MRDKKRPLASLTGSGRACFYACFFTLCQAGMPNVLEENTRNKKEEFRLRQRLRVNRRTTNNHQLICVLIIIRHFVRGEAKRSFFIASHVEILDKLFVGGCIIQICVIFIELVNYTK